MSETAVRDIPAPKWAIMKKTMEQKTANTETHQWLVRTERDHVVRVVMPITDGKVVPPRYGETNHVLVTTRHYLTDDVQFAETTVYASNEDGDFFNAPLYVTPGIREVWEAMYAIGEN